MSGFTIEHCTEGYLIIDILIEEGVSAIVGPLLTDRSKIELKESKFKSPGILAKAGITVAIMTDHPCVPIQHLAYVLQWQLERVCMRKRH